MSQIQRSASAVEFNTERTGTGTKEWSDASVNIGFGCSHGCLYCYAMDMMRRFNKIKTPEDWTVETVNLKKSKKGYQLREGVIMFPTTHDITPYYLPYAVESLKKMLIPGNKVLIVSKPHLDCIKTLCDELANYKSQILFRFTIGTIDPRASRFWEPGAPAPAERIESLKHACKAGYSTSVSMEPMLGGVNDALMTFLSVLPHITETIWIGKMNQPRQRVGMKVPETAAAVRRIEELQDDNEIMRLVKTLHRQPKVAWKDSIKKVIAKN
jgi:DNA repair photolyase